MNGFTLLWSKILDSSIWMTDKETRLVWITMLAMKDSEGVVKAARAALAHRARVTDEECEKALQILLSPDSQSGTTDNEGRRIREVPGGWLILNHELYRYSTEAKREFWRQQKQEQRMRADEKKPKPKMQKSEPRPILKRPELPEIKLAMAKAGLPETEAEKFLNHYESNGWRVGKNPMKSWPHAVGNWAANYRANNFGTKPPDKPKPIKSTPPPPLQGKEQPPEVLQQFAASLEQLRKTLH